MRIIVCGGRAMNDSLLVCMVLDALHHRYRIEEIAQGGGTGADHLAVLWAIESEVLVESYPAAWAKHGKAAGPIRNKQMLEDFKPDAVVAFAGSKGTAGMVKLAEDAGVYVYKFN